MKANASKRKIFDAVDMLTENTSAKTTEVKAENGVEQIASRLLMKALAVPRNGSVLKAMVRSSWRILFRLFQGIFCAMP